MTEPATEPVTQTGQAFDLQHFLPYLLNQAAEAASKGFQDSYKSAYGMTRTQWRVLAHLGKFGTMTARDICARTHVEKTKVSRAVAALEDQGWLIRSPSAQDRRAEFLTLTDRGRVVFADLGQRAIAYDRTLRAQLGPKVAGQLDDLLYRIIGLQPTGEGAD